MKLTNWQPCECHGVHNCPSDASRDATMTPKFHDTFARAIDQCAKHYPPITSDDIAADITKRCKAMLLAGEK